MEDYTVLMDGKILCRYRYLCVMGWSVLLLKRSVLSQNASNLYFLNGESHSYFKIYMEIKLAKSSQYNPKEKD